MTKERKDQLEKAAKVVGLLLGVVALTAAMKSGAFAVFVPRQEYERDRARDELRYQRDSLAQREILLWVRWNKCVKNRGERYCLDPDRP